MSVDASAGMVLSIYNKQHVGVLHCEFGHLLNEIQDMIRDVNAFFIIFKQFSVLRAKFKSVLWLLKPWCCSIRMQSIANIYELFDKNYCIRPEHASDQEFIMMKNYMVVEGFLLPLWIRKLCAWRVSILIEGSVWFISTIVSALELCADGFHIIGHCFIVNENANVHHMSDCTTPFTTLGRQCVLQITCGK